MRIRSIAALVLAMIVGGMLCFGDESAPQQAKPSRLQAMQKEKVRLLALRRKLIKEKTAPREMFRLLNATVAQGNYEQYKANITLMNRYVEYMDQADRKHLDDKVKLYAKLAECHKVYAKQNEALFKAYKAYDSGAFNDALAEIEKIEQRINALGGKISRDWFLPSELEKVPLPGQESAQPKTTTTAPKSS